MNFRLESYDTRYSGWMACTLFADDFTACRTVGEAQGLLDRVSAAYMAHTFRVRYESVLTPGDPLRLHALDQPKARITSTEVSLFR